MSFAQQLLQEGEIRAKTEMIEKLLRAGISWATIETATEITPARFDEMKQELIRLTTPENIDTLTALADDHSI